jgi:hypothetical protein
VPPDELADFSGRVHRAAEGPGEKTPTALPAGPKGRS